MPVAKQHAVVSALLGSLRSGLVAVDAGGAIVALSDEAARILCAGNPASAIGRSIDDVFAMRPEVCEVLHGALAGREMPSRAEMALGPDTAGARRIGFTVTPVREGARLIGAALWFRDLTPFERMDEQERLRNRLAALGQMAAGMAHEIRNPLASIELLAGLLERAAPGDADVQELVGDLVEEVHAVAGTVRATLDYVKPRSPVRRPTRVADVLRDVARRARGRSEAALELQIECGDGLEAQVDPDQLRALAGHLVSNALEGMVALGHGVARVRAEGDGEGGLRLWVDDSGPGVPQDLRDRVFYPFFTTRAEGTGVGLAEVQKIAVAHGGTVEVVDSPLGGARFAVVLPPGSEPGRSEP